MNQRTEQGGLTVEVDQSVCIGAGQCVFAVPTVFTQRDDDGVVELLDEHPAEELAEDVEEAVVSCPAQAIALRRRSDDG